MDARLQLYNDIMGVVKTKIPEIAHFGLWNQDAVSVEDEVPFERPALFLEFGEIEWGQYTKEPHGLGSIGKGVIRLHLVTDWMDDADYVVPFRIGEKIGKVLRQIPCSTSYSVFLPSLTLTDHNHSDILENIEEYAVKFRRTIEWDDEEDGEQRQE